MGASSEMISRNVSFQFGCPALGCAKTHWSDRAGRPPVCLFGTEWMFGVNAFSSCKVTVVTLYPVEAERKPERYCNKPSAFRLVWENVGAV